MSTLDSPAVAGLLKGLFEEADRADPAAMARAQAALSTLKEAPSARQRAELMRNVYMPISPDVGLGHPSGGGGARRRRRAGYRH
jgi:hypothetical protein